MDSILFEATLYLAAMVIAVPLSVRLGLGSVLGYLIATTAVYLLAAAVALARGVSLAEAAVEAQCAAIGNIGFLGLPMLTMLMGEGAVAIIMMIVDTTPPSAEHMTAAPTALPAWPFLVIG